MKQNFTDGSNTDDGVAAATVSSINYRKPYACHLPGDSCIHTAGLRAIRLALKHVYHSKHKPVLILSYSLSTLQAIRNLTYDQPVLIKIHELYWQLIQEEREIISVWVSGHVDIRGNSAADYAAKDASSHLFCVSCDEPLSLVHILLVLFRSDWYPTNVF